MAGLGDRLEMDTQAVEIAGNRLRNVGTGFQGQWAGIASAIEGLQGQLGKGRLGEAAMPRLHEASSQIGPVADGMGGKLTGIGGAAGQASVDYQHADSAAASTFPVTKA